MMRNSILFIVVKAANELDFLLPVIIRLREKNPALRIEVFYACIDKQEILRGSKYYHNIFKEYQVEETDISDKLRGKNVFSRGGAVA